MRHVLTRRQRLRVLLLCGVVMAPAWLPKWDGSPSVAWGDDTTLSSSAAAEEVDLRGVFDRAELPLRGQGGRGTCSVFAVAGAMEYALCKREGEQQVPVTRLSVEFLNWASNQVLGEPEDGSFFSDLWNGFTKYGVCAEDEMPYGAEFDPALRPTEAALAHAGEMRQAGFDVHWIKPWNPHKGLTEDQFQAVKATLRRGWPVCGGFLWPKKAQWVAGVLQMAPRKDVRDGHSVLLVGFRDDAAQPGGGVFLVRDSGQGRGGSEMSYEYVRTYMNDALWVDVRAGIVSQ